MGNLTSKPSPTEPKVTSIQPYGLDPAHLPSSIQSFKTIVFGGPAERATTCIRDSSTDRIVSYISCRVYRDEKGVIGGQFAQPPPKMQLPDLTDPTEREYWEWFWTELRSRIRAIDALHRPVVVIQVLATDPAWQRRGAASMLLDWLFSFAAEARLRVAVKPASLTIQIGFYERFGFQICQEMTLVDNKRWPEREAVYAPMMIKSPEK
ncbi:MAG: hypothetical protein Q9160_005649 [Pyrenula sp. 1 TL-2023]